MLKSKANLIVCPFYGFTLFVLLLFPRKKTMELNLFLLWAILQQVSQTFSADISEEVTIPQFLRDLSDQEVTEGDTVTFIVQLTGSPLLISYTVFICESLKHAKVILKGGMATIHKIGENVCNWKMNIFLKLLKYQFFFQY
jgi:hypothetical protein